MCETDGITHLRAGQLATGYLQGSLLTYIQQGSHPELAEKIERLFCFLGCDDRVSDCRQRWTWQCDRGAERRRWMWRAAKRQDHR